MHLEQETLTAISSKPPQRRINLTRVGHVYYKHTDLEKAAQFLVDFGFTPVKRGQDKIYFAGYGREPFLYCAEKGEENSFGGAAWVVDSMEDLELASETLPNASKIYALVDAPGNGYCVTFNDPVDGFPFHLVYGQTEKETSESFPKLIYNYPDEKRRTGGQYQRFQKGPAPIHKMGHFGMCVTNFESAFEFYTTHFNLKPSDMVYDDNGKFITAFLHLDLGKELVDHHSFFLFQGPKFHVHHSSFEVHDFDIQVLGHDWLKEKGYENCWGVGRHIMGSQIFDYWFDTSKFILEHYVDGDLVDCTTPVNKSKAEPGNLHIWGPDLPPTFME